MGRFRPSFTPLKPSSLRGLSGPTSPASPTSPRIPLHFASLPSPRAKPSNAFNLSNPIPIEPPAMPMPWIWSCHKCHSRYLLGATRRCLQDGHYFCGGITVDEVSGKVKQHKACVSEFDYSGWEDFGKWKRATIGPVLRHGSKHCEDDCDFPSSCHWKEQYAIKETGFAYLDPNCLNKEPDASSVKAKLAVEKGTGNYIDKVRRAAESGLRKAARGILPPIQEEDQKTPAILATTPKLNGLCLHYPVMDFASSKNGANESSAIGDESQMSLLAPESPQMSAQVENVWEDDVDMTDWITQDVAESAPILSWRPARGN